MKKGLRKSLIWIILRTNVREKQEIGEEYMDLFEYAKSKTMENESPLASRLRPTRLEEVVGQQHIVGRDKLLYRAIKADKLTVTAP